MIFCPIFPFRQDVKVKLCTSPRCFEENGRELLPSKVVSMLWGDSLIAATRKISPKLSHSRVYKMCPSFPLTSKETHEIQLRKPTEPGTNPNRPFCALWVEAWGFYHLYIHEFCNACSPVHPHPQERIGFTSCFKERRQHCCHVPYITIVYYPDARNILATQLQQNYPPYHSLYLSFYCDSRGRFVFDRRRRSVPRYF